MQKRLPAAIEEIPAAMLRHDGQTDAGRFETNASTRDNSVRRNKGALRLEDVSQSVFASYLNVTKDSVSKWMRRKEPAGPSLKLLSLVERKGLA